MPAIVRRNRLLFEPAVALVFLLAGGVATTSIGSRDQSVILLLAIAIGVARISPAGSLTAGAIALVAGIAASPGPSILGWLLVAAGVIVFFASSAYGSAAARWVGLAGALVVTSVACVLILNLPAALGSLPDTAAESGIVQAFAEGVLLVGALQLVAALICGSWAVGVITRSRALHGVAPVGSLENWIMRGDREATDRPVMRPSRFVRELSRTQFALDVIIAVGFLSIDVMTLGVSSFPGALVVLGLAGALMFRRLAPAASLGLAWVAACIQMAANLDILTADLAILVVLYATAAYGGRILKWVGLASVGVGAACAAGYLVMLNDGFSTSGPNNLGGFALQFVGYFVAFAAVLGLSWTLGLLMRTWQTARANKLLEVQAVNEGLVAQRTVIVEQERNRIARDMHDVVAHSLAVVIAQADGARYARALDPSAVDTALTTISSTAREALGDVRLLLADRKSVV